jgi:hypothetical protein
VVRSPSPSFTSFTSFAMADAKLFSECIRYIFILQTVAHTSPTRRCVKWGETCADSFQPGARSRSSGMSSGSRVTGAIRAF